MVGMSMWVWTLQTLCVSVCMTGYGLMALTGWMSDGINGYRFCFIQFLLWPCQMWSFFMKIKSFPLLTCRIAIGKHDFQLKLSAFHSRDPLRNDIFLLLEALWRVLGGVHVCVWVCMSVCVRVNVSARVFAAVLSMQCNTYKSLGKNPCISIGSHALWCQTERYSEYRPAAFTLSIHYMKSNCRSKVCSIQHKCAYDFMYIHQTTVPNIISPRIRYSLREFKKVYIFFRHSFVLSTGIVHHLLLYPTLLLYFFFGFVLSVFKNICLHFGNIYSTWIH